MRQPKYGAGDGGVLCQDVAEKLTHVERDAGGFTAGGTEMVETGKPTDLELVKCEVCLKEIPKSEAQNAEAVDYVAYFCGLECYGEWEAERVKERTREAGEP